MLSLLIDGAGNAIKLYNQHRPRILRQADVKGCLHCANNHLVHHLDGARNNAGSDYRRHGASRYLNIVEHCKERAVSLWLAHEPEYRPGNNSYGAFRTNQRTNKVITT